MNQISMFDSQMPDNIENGNENPNKKTDDFIDEMIAQAAEKTYPASYEDIDEIIQEVMVGEKDKDAFSSKEIAKGQSYFFFGSKVMEFFPKASEKGKARLRVKGEIIKAIGQVNESIKEDKWYTVLPMSTGQYKKLIEALKLKKKEIFDNLTVEPIACCSSFIECSDAKKCLHADDRFYNNCEYRKNLEQGRIFYGKNKNAGALCK